MGRVSAHKKRMRDVWVQRNASDNAPHLYNSNSKQQPAPKQQQEQQPGSPPAGAPPNTEHILHQLTPLSSAEVQRREQAAAAAERQHKEDKQAAAERERLIREAFEQRHKEAAAETERQRKIIKVLHKQLDSQQQNQQEAEAEATTAFQALLTDRDRLAEQLDSFNILMADGMSDKVLFLINHPCGIKQLRKLAAADYYR
jgi:tRNA A37 N6-isopentenylltransferase MiaA